MSQEDKRNALSAGISCPVPLAPPAIVRLGHGSGGKMTSDLIQSVFLPELSNPILAAMEDAAAITVPVQKLAVTTDSYVVSPVFFPGGDIGSLAVHGTVNDLAMRGARPLFITASFILEEGLALDDLTKIVRSMAGACRQAGIQLIAGDTKVVNHGAADKIFITTSGIGSIECKSAPGADRARAGDCVIVSGDLGRHGMAIMCARAELELETLLESDSGPLWDLVQTMLEPADAVHCLRDLTRGGLASALNELAGSSTVGIEIDEQSIPISGPVRAACEVLGLDPLYVACEGRLVAIVSKEHADELLSKMQSCSSGSGAHMIGRVVSEHAGRVVLNTRVGGRRIVDKLSGEQLPRIC